MNETELREALAEFDQRIGYLENSDNNAFVHELAERVNTLELKMKSIPLTRNEYQELKEDIKGLRGYVLKKVAELSKPSGKQKGKRKDAY